jgi:Tfp pilus assembly PilM family ATPase
MILLTKKRIPTMVLGLAFNGGRLEGALVKRSNGSLQVLKSFNAPLALNPLTGDAELVGREIRNHLEQAGIRERRCAVCLPSNWALALQTEVPDMPDEDVPSFLEIEAERGFPYGLGASVSPRRRPSRART